LYNNEITIELFNGSYSYDGLTQCEIQVYSGEDLSTLATSAKFSFRANRPILNDESIVQTREFPILTSLISEVKELRDAYNSIIKENGDMTMEVYDVDENGIVDDAERLGGELPEHYATSEGVAAIQDTISTLRVDLDAVGEVVETLTPDDIGAASLDEYGAVPGTQNFSHMTWFSDEQRTLQQSDAGRTLMPYDSDNPGKAYTINIPANSDVEINRDAEFAVFRYFEGTITVVPASGVGLRYIGVDDSSINRPIRIANRYGMVALKKISNTAWIVTGDIEEA